MGDSSQMVAAILAMTSFTFILMPITAAARFLAVKRGTMKASQFKYMQLEGAPEFVTKTTRHWLNLYEVPVIFYVLCLLCLQLDLEDSFFAALAWAYVGARFVHSLVHITYNNVSHRFVAFAVSNLILLIIFVRLVILVANLDS